MTFDTRRSGSGSLYTASEFLRQRAGECVSEEERKRRVDGAISECFSPSLATVAAARLQPVVFSRTHHTRSLLLQLSASARWTPGLSPHIFPLLLTRWRPFTEDKEVDNKTLSAKDGRIRELEGDRDRDRGRGQEGWSPSVLVACPGFPGLTPSTAVRICLLASLCS